MSILLSKDKTELIATCGCSCDDSIHIIIDKEDNEEYMFLTYMNANWYRDQNNKIFRVIGKKIKKIWSIICNKDFYYSEIIMNKEDFEEFKEYINSIE